MSAPLSHDAAAVLLELQLQRARPGGGVGAPITDRALAGKLGLAQRAVIDLALELIEAGHIVVASCDAHAPGRFLLLPSDDLAAAYQYARDLDERGVAVLHRARAFRAALAAAELQRNPDSRGQLNFGSEVRS